MSDANIRPVLAGQKALVIGVANDQSIGVRLCQGVPHSGCGCRNNVAE